MWRTFRDQGANIISTWIDEAGAGETASLSELWDRILREIAGSACLVLYAEQDDFPLKGALVEVGIALGLGKPIIVCLPGVKLDGRTHRPIGSWIECRQVSRCDDICAALSRAGMPEPKPLPEGYELFDGKPMKVLNGERSGWWRFHNHYDRDGYCDNPGRGY